MLHVMRLWLLVAAFLVAGAAQARDEPMWEPTRQSLVAKQEFGVEELRKIFIRAGAKRVWIPVMDSPGELHLKHSRQGKHEATVGIKYDATGYELFYVGSYNLNSKPEAKRIHPTYNLWLRNLSADIEAELALAAVK